MPLHDHPIRYGRAFDAADIANAAHVCLLSNTAYERLFPMAAIRRQQRPARRPALRDRRRTCQANGVEVNLGRTDVQVPYTTYGRDFARGSFLFGARFIVADTSQLAATESAATEFFRKLKAGHVEYQTVDKRTIAQGISGIIGAVTFLVAVIGAVSLVWRASGSSTSCSFGRRTYARDRHPQSDRRHAAASAAAVFRRASLISLIGCGIGLVLASRSARWSTRSPWCTSRRRSADSVAALDRDRGRLRHARHAGVRHVSRLARCPARSDRGPAV